MVVIIILCTVIASALPPAGLQHEGRVSLAGVLAFGLTSVDALSPGGNNLVLNASFSVSYETVLGGLVMILSTLGALAAW